MYSFDLVAEPWIPVLASDGVRAVGLADVFAGDIASLATGDSGEDVAVFRLLLAIAIAADAENLTPAQWVVNHRDDFDLFHPQRPFAQNVDMARFLEAKGASKPITDLSYSHSGAGRPSSNQFHSSSGLTLTHAEAARMLLVRHSFSGSGAQPFTGSLFPTPRHPGNGEVLWSHKGKFSMCTSRMFAWIDAGSLADTLAANVTAVRGRPLGQFHFTWTHGYPPVYLAPEGILDGLTYLSRSIYLIPAAEVARGMLCGGVRWPEEEDKLGYTADRQMDLLPFVFYPRSGAERKAIAAADKKAADAAAAGKPAPARSTKTYPRATPKAAINKTPWRDLLGGIADGHAPQGVFSHAHQGQTLRIAGMAAGGSGNRIDGVFSGSLPVPAGGVSAAAAGIAVDEHIERHLMLQWVLRELRRFDPRFDAKEREKITLRVTAELHEAMYPVVCAALTGAITAKEMDQHLGEITTAADDAVVAAAGSARPDLAGQLKSRRDVRWEYRDTNEDDTNEDDTNEDDTEDEES